MKTVETEISWGHLPLIEIFADANNLKLVFEQRSDPESVLGFITIRFEEDTDTDIAITCMAIKHLGFKNMLDDYLIKCGIDPIMIPIGYTAGKRDPVQLEKDWQEQRRKIGLTVNRIV